MEDKNRLMKNPEISCEILIVGAGQAGGRVARCLRDAAFEGSIVMVGAEPVPPYERPPLSKEYLAGCSDEDSLWLQPEGAWREQGVQLRLGARVAALDRHARKALLDDGTRVGYDKLVVTTGGAARRLRVPGSGAAHMLTLRSLADAQALRARMGGAKRLAVVGGGVIGLELASTARKAGLEVQVFEAGAYPMGRILCPTASQWLTALHAQAGVVLRLGAQLESVDLAETGFRLRARLVDGTQTEYEADLAVAAIGVDVAQDFLTASGLGDEDGMRVDAHCRSLVDADCYAAGDLARADNAYLGQPLRQETWRNAENQAQAVAGFLTGGRTEPYEELPWMWTDQHGRNIQVVGIPRDITQTIVRGQPGAAPFAIFWLKEGVLRGGVLVDSGKERRFLEQLVKARREVSEESLANPAVSLKSLL